MQILKAVCSIGLVALVSCASSKKEVNQVEERSFKKDYHLVDASSKVLPTWIDAPEKGDKSKARAKNKYFINESSNISKRLCVRSAEARATAKIAQEIAQFLKNSYSEASQGGADEDVTEYMQEQLATESQAFVVGSSVVKTYWEKRAYKEVLGAPENISKYNCFALVKMSNKNLDKAISMSRAKLLSEIKDPEVKKKTDAALKDVANKFKQIDA